MPGKLRLRWTGPYWIVKADNGTYQLGTLSGDVLPQWVNGFRLNPYYGKMPANPFNGSAGADVGGRPHRHSDLKQPCTTGRKPTKSYEAAGQPYDGGPADRTPFVRDGRETATRSVKTDPDHGNSGGSELGSARPGQHRESKGTSSTAKDEIDGYG
jgi:hypothetical protein